MNEKYFKIVDTTKSDMVIREPLTEEEIDYNIYSIDYNKKQIDKMLDEIESLRVYNYYMAHSLKKNGHDIEKIENYSDIDKKYERN
jgi:hypothetical protein